MSQGERRVRIVPCTARTILSTSGCLAAILAAASLLLVFAAPAGALSRVSLGSFGSETGFGGGAIRGGKGLAVNRTGAGGATAGDVYVGDSGNHRIQQFSASGEFIRAWGAGVVPGAAAGTANLTSVSGTGSLTAGSNQVTGVTGSFAAGQTISGAGIPTETTISSVGVGTLTLSKVATASGSGVPLTAGEVTSVVTTSKAFVPGQTVTGSGIPAGTRIAAVTTGVGAASKLTLSNAVTATATGVSLTVSESPGNIASNEKQTITVPGAATGEYKLKFKTTSPTAEAETAPIPVGASAAEVEAALTALSNVGSGNVSVTETASRTYLVEFQGKFADTNVEQLTVSAQPAGGTVTVTTNQQGAQPFEICTTSCAAGAASAIAGGMNVPAGLSIDQETGSVHVVDSENRRVAVFGATGTFQGAFGWEVDASAPIAALQFCTAATGCRAGAVSELAGGFSNFASGFGSSAVDPTDGGLYVSDPGNVRVNEFDLIRNGSGEVTGVAFIRAIGWKVNSANPEEKVQTCSASCQKGLAGAGQGQFSSGGVSPGGISVDSQGNLYAVNLRSGIITQPCLATAPCRILKFDSSGSFVEVFGPAVGESTGNECQVNSIAGAQNTVAVLDVAVDPSDDHVFALKATGAGAYRVLEFDEEGGKSKAATEKCEVSPPPASPALPAAGAVANTHGLAVGIENRLYAQHTSTITGRVFILGPAPPPTVEMISAEATGPYSAELVGEVTPPDEIEGQAFATGYRFEYSTTNSPDPDDWTRTPVPDGSAGSQPVPQTKEAQITGLSANTRYFARICGTTAQTVCSDALEFRTAAIGPTIVLTFSEEVTQTAATLGARIAPNNLPTTYHFEWASPEEWEAAPNSYGHSIPANDRQIGRGPEGEIVNVEEALAGLSQASVYHFRVVATNEEGTTFGPDQEVETLNSCGLIDSRCFELVSPAEKGPVAIPLMPVNGSGYDNRAQAAPEGGGFAYSVALGFPDATAGEEVIYLSRRGSGGWSSVQISPSAPPSPELRGESSPPSRTKAVASSLDCSIVASAAPLTSDAPMQVVEGGGMNLFRRDNLTGAYTLVTDLPPVNPEGKTEGNPIIVGTDEEYEAVGVSPDCERFVFRSPYIYPGLAGAKRVRTYEWNDGELSSVALIPGAGGPSEPVAADLVPGGVNNPGETISGRDDFNAWGAVPQVPGHVFFTAKSLNGGDTGRYALFLRQADGTAALDISQSRTSTVNRGALFQTATSDGSRAFFLANYGLVAPPEKGGTTADCTQASAVECDLYEWRAQGVDGCTEASGCLSDLTADQGHPANTAGAAVKGVLGISADAEHVYLAARGQLDEAGEGRTYAQNVSASTYNVYLLHEDEFHFVGAAGAAQVANGLLVNGPGSSASIAAKTISATSQVTPDGEHLLFESAADVTGYASGGATEAYLYSADSDETVCVSCRRDGDPSLNPASFRLLRRLDSPMAPVLSLAADGQRAMFISQNRLAAGAVAGQLNLYQWKRGQIALIDTAEAGNPVSPQLSALGMSEDGTDLYLITAAQLAGEDFDGRRDIYDARIGGGFPPKPAPPVPCDPLGEGACQGSGSPPPPSAPAPSSSTFFGPGNQPPAPAKNKKQQKKKKHKKKKKQQKRKTAKQKARPAQGTARDAGANRGAAK